MKKLIFFILRTYDIGPLFGGEENKIEDFCEDSDDLEGFRGL
jgi:hypothetical protein